MRVEVTTLAPRAPTRTDEAFQVAGRLTNCGELPLTRLQVRLGVGSKIDSRSGLARADEEPVLGGRRLPPVPAALESLAPGQATTFDLRLIVGDLALGRDNGVFPLAVQAQARYGDALVRGSVGLASTFVPWFPDGPTAPTRIAWLLPLMDQPRRAPDGALLDDELDALLDSNLDRAGRLHRVLAAAREGAKGGCDQPAARLGQEPAPPEVAPPAPVEFCRGEAVPVTYAVDPELLSAVESMVRPYVVVERGSVESGRHRRTPSPGSAPSGWRRPPARCWPCRTPIRTSWRSAARSPASGTTSSCCASSARPRPGGCWGSTPF